MFTTYKVLLRSSQLTKGKILKREFLLAAELPTFLVAAELPMFFSWLRSSQLTKGKDLPICFV
jgi:hypothetical protein